MQAVRDKKQTDFRIAQCPLCCEGTYVEMQFKLYKMNVISWGM